MHLAENNNGVANI